MKRSFAASGICAFLFNTAVAVAESGAESAIETSNEYRIVLTSQPGLKIFLTVLVYILLLSFMSWLTLRKLEGENRRRTILLFMAAVLISAAVGIIGGLLISMSLVIAIEKLFTVTIEQWLRNVLTFVISSLVVFLGIKLAANKLVRYYYFGLNFIVLVMSLFANSIVFIWIFEMVNRIIK